MKLSRMNRLSIAIVLAALSLLPMASVGARTIEGYRFDESVRVGAVNLQLNGVGVRAVSVFKGYVAALYVPQRTSNAQLLLGETGPKRVALRMLLGADANTFIKALSSGMQHNSTDIELARLQGQIETFNNNLRQVPSVKPGDLVYVEFMPGSGTRVSLNGRLLGKPVPGDEFYVAFLKIFIGEKVQDPRLKAGLLGARGAL
jgi:hypothetical protein